MPPPNPVRSLDNSLNDAQQRGQAFYFGPRPSDGIDSLLLNQVAGQSSFTCSGCHVFDPFNGLLGTGGNQSFEVLPQTVKIPHLRNLYDKIGMFGSPAVSFFGLPDSGPTGDQIRGFGFTNDGSRSEERRGTKERITC